MDQLKQWIGLTVNVVHTYHAPTVGILRAIDDRWLTLETERGIICFCLYDVYSVSPSKT
jgi:hypothetical protein